MKENTNVLQFISDVADDFCRDYCRYHDYVYGSDVPDDVCRERCEAICDHCKLKLLTI